MPSKIWTVMICVLGMTTTTQAQQALHCENLDPLEPYDAIRAFECVSKLDADAAILSREIDELRQEIVLLSSAVQQLNKNTTVPAIGDHVDTKAIVAYMSAKVEKTCPIGWSPFTEAKDRFILGAGGEYQTVGEMGGEDVVKLEPPQMPAHSHFVAGSHNSNTPLATSSGSMAVRSHYGSGRDYILSEGIAPPKFGKSSMAGGLDGTTLAHNNMPPYIALYFCKKD